MQSKEWVVNMGNVMDDIFNVVDILEEMYDKYTRIDKDIEKKEIEISDIYHFIEFLELTTEQQLKMYTVLSNVLEERRELKDSKILYTELFNKISIDTLRQSLEDKQSLLKEGRHYNIRENTSKEYLEHIFEEQLGKDFIEKGMTKEDLKAYFDKYYKDKKIVTYDEKKKDFQKKKMSNREVDKAIREIRKNTKKGRRW